MNTQTALLDHAETLSRSRGFDGFSFADLAAALNIRKPSVHHHFPTKSALALALITRYRDRFARALAQIDGTAADRLRAYVALYRHALGNADRLCLCVAFASHRDSFDAAIQAEISGFHHDSLNWLGDVYTLGQSDQSLPTPDAVSAAHACLATVEGAQIMARAAADLAIFNRATATLTPKRTPQCT
jgi:TetR/AcrR family transcriptional repressor of nem operon